MKGCNGVVAPLLGLESISTGLEIREDCSCIWGGEACCWTWVTRLCHLLHCWGKGPCMCQAGVVIVFVRTLLLRAWVSATLSLLISDKLLSFSFALSTFKWGKNYFAHRLREVLINSVAFIILDFNVSSSYDATSPALQRLLRALRSAALSPVHFSASQSGES